MARHEGVRWLVAWMGVLGLGSTAPATQLLYYGGPVVSNVKVIAVNWGPNVDAGLRNELAGFYAAVTGGDYFDWLNEYSTVGLNGVDGQPGSNQVIGRGSFGGSYTITPSVTATSVTNADVAAECVRGRHRRRTHAGDLRPVELRPLLPARPPGATSPR